MEFLTLIQENSNSNAIVKIYALLDKRVPMDGSYNITIRVKSKLDQYRTWLSSSNISCQFVQMIYITIRRGLSFSGENC